MTLGQRIQQIRTEHGLSQEAFAEKLGTTRQTVSRWELDQTFPEIEKVVRISRIFSVSTDSILKDGISTFETALEYFTCGVYRYAHCEIVETEKFAPVLYSSTDKKSMGAKLYRGYEDKKSLVALCERDFIAEETKFAYLSDESAMQTVITNNDELAEHLGSAWKPGIKNYMHRLETFEVDHTGAPLPTVKEAGISRCLTIWRIADSYHATHDKLNFYLCTGRTEYVFSIKRKDVDIYCGASCNIVFDLGLFGGGQFFRIRNYKENSEKWCGFYSDFSYELREIQIPTEQCVLGNCIQTSKGLMWCVKRYSDDEIVLQGCGEDEYIYRRTDKCSEKLVAI